MHENPYQPPSFNRSARLPKPPRSLAVKTANGLTITSAIVALFGALWMLLMLKWINDAEPHASLVEFCTFAIWLASPQLGAVCVAALFRNCVTASLAILLGITASALLGGWAYYHHWSTLGLFDPPELRGHVMCCVPIDMLFAPLQWISVVFTAIAASLVWSLERTLCERLVNCRRCIGYSWSL